MNEATTTTNANAEVDTIASLPLLLLQDNEVEVLLQKMKSEDTNICHHESVESLVSPIMEEDDGSLSSSSEEDSLCSIGEDFFHVEDN